VEFRIDNADAYIMEVNGRFWGSIEVSVRCGLNYPVQLYEMQYLNKEVPKGLPVKYVRVRNVKEEIVNNIRAIVLQKSLKTFFIWLATFKGALNSNEIIEDNIFDDPGFVLSSYYDVVARNVKRVIQVFQTKRVSVTNHQTVVRPGKSCVIGFACTGNICRSPFAELYARKFNSKHQYFSFGSVNSENRMSPVNAVQAADQLGVGLSAFKSSVYHASDVAKADYIFVMDRQNYVDMLGLGISKEKLFFLDGAEIADPYGKSVAEFTLAYEQVIRGIQKSIPIS
jgi:protein-tyrosine-phosphatase